MDKTINIDIAVIYQWYDHLILRDNGDAEKVTAAIENGDYETFMYYYNKYPPFKSYYDDEEISVPYFPDTAYIWYQDQLIGNIDITNPLGFSMITYSEYECG